MKKSKASPKSVQAQSGHFLVESQRHELKFFIESQEAHCKELNELLVDFKTLTVATQRAVELLDPSQTTIKSAQKAQTDAIKLINKHLGRAIAWFERGGRIA